MNDELGQAPGDHDRLLLVFGYLGPLALVSLLASRREFVKWHAKQGLVLWLALAALHVVLQPLLYLFDRPWLAFLAELVRAAGWIAVLGVVVAMLVCIVRGLDGERYRLPIVSDLADRL